MNLHPIIFSAPMIRAIIDRAKTQTRRTLPNPDHYGCPTGDCPHDSIHHCIDSMNQPSVLQDCRYGKPGDVLWVREAWDLRDWNGAVMIGYGADGCQQVCTPPKSWDATIYPHPRWRSPLHMPLWACRLFLRLESVRVHKLQDISEEDIIAEGIRIPVTSTGQRLLQVTSRNGPAPIEYIPIGVKLEELTDADFLRAYFGAAWDTINRKRPGASFSSNPWVFALGFSVLSTTGVPGLPEQVARTVRDQIERLSEKTRRTR